MATRRLWCVLALLAGCTGTLGRGANDGAGDSHPGDGIAGDSRPGDGTAGEADLGDGAGDDVVGCAGETLVPWAGGAAYYAGWSHGPSSDPSFFPIAVWLQSPARAGAYAAIGINQYVGLWQGPTEVQLGDLAGAGMPVLATQNATGLVSVNAEMIHGWTQQDEPDNAQPDGSGGYDPCVERSVIQGLYADMVAADPTRPVLLNFGRGVAHEDWVGRGTCTGHLEHYPLYALGADIVSFDIYPMNSAAPVYGNLWYVAQGIDRLQAAVNREKPVWNWIETGQYGTGGSPPTPEQVRSEVWMSIIHGSMGIGYFVHQFEPTFIEAALLANPTMSAAVAAINARLTELAPVLNTQSSANAVTVTLSNSAVPVDTMLKRYGGATYLFAVAMRAGDSNATFEVTCLAQSATATVLDESRSLPVIAGSFTDHFSDYQAHLYRIEGM
jgi:hypothetical protein